MKRFVFIGLISLLILAAACTRSQVDPDADIRIGGTVTRQSGETSPDTKVLLGREGDLGEAFGVAVFLGLTCLNEDPPAICRKAEVQETGEDGRFSFDVKGRFTQGTFGQANTVVLTSRLARNGRELEGPAATHRFQVQTNALDMPMGFWEPTVELTADPLQGKIGWSELPGTVAPQDANLASANTIVSFRQQGDLIWTFGGATSGMNFDTRLLEDSRGDVSITATVEDLEVSDQRGRSVDVILRSARFAYASPAGKPFSRGKPCSAYRSNGEVVPQASCRLTDGNFAEQFEPETEPPCPHGQQCPATMNKSALVDLQEVREIRLVVVRGCNSSCRVEASTDGQNVVLLGTISGTQPGGQVYGDGAIAPNQPLSARYIKVTADQSIDELREVSVWDPTAPSAPAVPAGPSIIVEPDRVPEGREIDAGRNWLPWMAAGVVALVVLVLFIVMMTRRKRTTTS